MNDNQVLELQPTIQAWADIVIKEWIKKVEAFGIGRTGDLLNSFKNTVHWAAGGDLKRVEFVFEYYGKFVDWGVGNGVKLADRGDWDIRRKPKPWYSETFYKEVMKLRCIISERVARNTQLLIVNGITVDQNKL